MSPTRYQLRHPGSEPLDLPIPFDSNHRHEGDCCLNSNEL